VRNFKPEGQFTLAARITGKVKTAFPDGKPKDEDEGEDEGEEKKDSSKDSSEEETGKHLTESTESVNLIVVADTDILEDKFWVRVQNIFWTTARHSPRCKCHLCLQCVRQSQWQQ